MSLASQVSTAFTRVATEFKTLRADILAKYGDPTTLQTNSKVVVGAINELKSATATAAGIDDAGALSTTKTWSSSKTSNTITTAVAGLVNAAPAALDTLGELAAQLATDEGAAASLTTAVGNRVRYDAAQTLTAPQLTQVQSNIGVLSSAAIGDPTTDFSGQFVAALV